MKILGKWLLFLALCLFVKVAYSQTGTITNISVQQRTDGSGMVDVYYTLNGNAASYNVLIEASFDGDNTYTPVPSQYLSGDVSGISSGNRHIVWDGLGSFPDTFSTQAKVKILANEIGGWQPGNGVTDIDGNYYPSVIIGNQEWMAENLKTTKYRNGVPIVYPGTDNTAWQNNITGAYAIYPHQEIEGLNSDLEVFAAYGALYNWYAINNPDGLCPTGWHVPTDNEWTELIDYLVGQGYPNELDSLNGAGNALKSCLQVSSPLGGDCATSEHPRWDSLFIHYGTDEFGFSALPGGLRSTSGNYNYVGQGSYWWSSINVSSTYGLIQQISCAGGSLSGAYIDKDLGFSVRCVKD